MSSAASSEGLVNGVMRLDGLFEVSSAPKPIEVEGNGQPADLLALVALYQLELGEDETAKQTLSEAKKLEPGSAAVRNASLLFEIGDKQNRVIQIVATFLEEDQVKAGSLSKQELAKRHPKFSWKSRRQPIEKLYSAVLKGGTDLPLLLALLKRSGSAKAFIVGHLEKAPVDNIEIHTILFWGAGDAAMRALVLLLLESSIWADPHAQTTCQLFVLDFVEEKLLKSESGTETTALANISRFIMDNAKKYRKYISKPLFEKILDNFDVRSQEQSRNLAKGIIFTLTLLPGQPVFADWLETALFRKVTRGQGEGQDLITPCSILSNAFQICPTAAVSSFLSEGVVPSLVMILEQKENDLQLKYAILDLFAAACVTPACSKDVATHCLPQMRRIILEDDESVSLLAGIVMTKISGHEIAAAEADLSKSFSDEDMDQLSQKFRDALSTNSVTLKRRGSEGLSYLTVHPRMQKKLADDEDFLALLCKSMDGHTSDNEIQSALLRVIYNMTKFPPHLTEEQERMLQLRAYASGKRPNLTIDPLSKSKEVQKRCGQISKLNFEPVLLRLIRELGPLSVSLALETIIPLLTNRDQRRSFARHGAIPTLIAKYVKESAKPEDSRLAPEIPIRAAHALARILSTVDPTLAFSDHQAISNVVRPLLSLLIPLQPGGDRDVQPLFEGLMALTNVASVDQTSQRIVISSTFDMIQDLFFATNFLIRRAAVELNCNLVTTIEGAMHYSIDAPRGPERMEILLKFVDMDDLPTRTAAGGTIASLSAFAPAMENILHQEKGVRRILGMCEKGNTVEIQHRGIACILNLDELPPDIQERAAQAYLNDSAVVVLRKLAQHLLFKRGKEGSYEASVERAAIEAVELLEHLDPERRVKEQAGQAAIAGPATDK
ncbi:MAG: hypothetical protein M1814_006650 [Vezdaea aestivalis]|nr:MAG: hypothetical protein M1814_006650 [Vezdaea aestivalis]